jgi:hypothetical protein
MSSLRLSQPVFRTLAAAVLAAGLQGCSLAAPTGDVTAPAKQTVVSFLEAIKRGDDATARNMLSVAARTKTDEMGIAIAPPVADTATYAVRECEVVSDAGDIVHVGTTWTDVDGEGFQTSENVVWVVRLDPEGWRVVGMAMRVFEDLPPLLLDFEDPEDMLAKQEMVAEELERRATTGQPAGPQTARQPAGPQQPARR